MFRRLQWLFLFFSVLCAGPLFAQKATRLQPKPTLLRLIDLNLHQAATQYKVLMSRVPAERLPKTYYANTDKLETSDSRWWTSGFYPGTLLYLYGYTRDTSLLREALARLDLLKKEQYNKGTHDLGFMMYCSYGNALRLSKEGLLSGPLPAAATESAGYDSILLNSARSLSTRFNPKVGCIRSWDSKPWKYPVIIDNMMNLELLFWATRVSGDSSFYKIAVTHANTTMRNHYRPDYSSFHVVDYDTATGKVLAQKTAQGYSDSSAWARGQAWGLYGYTMVYRSTHDPRYLEQAEHIAHFILTNPNLPADKIPYWDFNAPNIPLALRDASAAAVMASALIELSRYVSPEKGRGYLDIAEQIIVRLSSNDYKAVVGSNGGFLLRHSVGHFPAHSEVDVPLTYADYYFVEAMLRYKALGEPAAKSIPAAVKLIPVARGWARNSVNAVVFRHNSLTSWKDTQFVAFYDGDRNLVLGKRRLGSENWQLSTTPYKGNTADAHNTISLMADGDGYLHVSWDHHNNVLRYCHSVRPGSLEMTAKMPMTGLHEDKVTYPEFYRLPDGGLLFLYRDGASGNGNLVVDRYDRGQQKWTQLQSDLIDGEGRRNAYWQACMDGKGTLHISWVWRESPDVSSNHDLAYARSTDGGRTWEKTSGEKYRLPITAATAEYACRVPDHSELINQTSMCADAAGHPYIATYWRPAGTTVPQYQLVWFDGRQWAAQAVTHRVTPFSLAGGGTKKIPISRPQVMLAGDGKKAYLVFRDAERGDRASVAVCERFPRGAWAVRDLTTDSLASWEPSYDTDLWQARQELDLFVERVEQGDGESLTDTPPQMISVLEWKP
ncbi:MAG TPA: BNR repeat-containing protein [Puia sp.]|jgi:hypothetical protein